MWSHSPLPLGEGLGVRAGEGRLIGRPHWPIAGICGRYGFAVAEAMDTSQRGMGLDWPMAQELIRRSIAEAKAAGGTVASGAGTDHLSPNPDRSIDEVIAAYEAQVGYC